VIKDSKVPSQRCWSLIIHSFHSFFLSVRLSIFSAECLTCILLHSEVWDKVLSDLYSFNHAAWKQYCLVSNFTIVVFNSKNLL
jgi:hypothetical protein